MRDRSLAINISTGAPASRNGAWSLLPRRERAPRLIGISLESAKAKARSARSLSPIASRVIPLPVESMLIMATMDSISLWLNPST